jgi:hypothetical protein
MDVLGKGFLGQEDLRLSGIGDDQDFFDIPVPQEFLQLRGGGFAGRGKTVIPNKLVTNQK